MIYHLCIDLLCQISRNINVYPFCLQNMVLSEAIKALLSSDYSRLLRVRGELTHGLPVRAHARTHKAPPVALSCAHSVREGKREQEEECEHCGVLGDSENIQFRLRPDSRCGSPMSFWTLLPFGAFHGARLRAGNAHARIADSGMCVETTRCPPSSWKDSAAYDCYVCCMFIVIL